MRLAGYITFLIFCVAKTIFACDGFLRELVPLSAELSSTHGSNKFTADKCIDNDTATFCHSGYTRLPYPWLVLDFGSIMEVKKVVIFNRAGCCGNELRDVEVHISNSKPNSEMMQFTEGNLLGNFYGWGNTGQVITMEKDGIARGRYVVVQHNARGWLQWLQKEQYWDGSLAHAREMGSEEQAKYAGMLDLAEVKVFGYLY
eukprot:GFUD01018572.1.p1 GENE.GFUD01018572.1~~GFUD01018572.1.p1  ORF type:complete len:201 (+),score=32.75 GFUD01018572.1:127-729(+)